MERVMEHVLRNMRRKHVRGNTVLEAGGRAALQDRDESRNSQAFRPCGLGGRQAIAKRASKPQTPARSQTPSHAHENPVHASASAHKKSGAPGECAT